MSTPDDTHAAQQFAAMIADASRPNRPTPAETVILDDRTAQARAFDDKLRAKARGYRWTEGTDYQPRPR